MRALIVLIVALFLSTSTSYAGNGNSTLMPPQDEEPEERKPWTYLEIGDLFVDKEECLKVLQHDDSSDDTSEDDHIDNNKKNNDKTFSIPVERTVKNFTQKKNVVFNKESQLSHIKRHKILKLVSYFIDKNIKYEEGMGVFFKGEFWHIDKIYCSMEKSSRFQLVVIYQKEGNSILKSLLVNIDKLDPYNEKELNL